MSTNADGSSTWSLPVALEVQTEEATYKLFSAARDCLSNTVLTSGNETDYLVDNTPPSIPPQTLTPGDHANAVFASQPLLAEISDHGGSGIDRDSVSFELLDESTGLSTIYPSGVVDWGVATNWAVTPNAALLGGHLYRLKVMAADAAGNTVEVSQTPAGWGGGFLAAQFEATKPMTEIPPVVCTVSNQVDLQTATKSATCQDVRVVLTSSEVSYSGTRHANDVGFVDLRAALGSAWLKSTLVGGVEDRRAAFPGRVERAWGIFETTPGMLGPGVAIVSGQEKALGSVSFRVPATWSNATLYMDPVIAQSASVFSCSNPVAVSASPNCGPDPLMNRRFVGLEPTVTDLEATAADHAARFGVSAVAVSDADHGYSAVIPPLSVQPILAEEDVAFSVKDAAQDAIDTLDGGCDEGRMRMRHWVPEPVEEETAIVAEASDGSCSPVILDSRMRSTDAFTQEACLVNVISTNASPAAADAGCTVPAPQAPNPTDCDVRKFRYVHTNHTLHGLEVSWDLAWLRTTYGRLYDGCNAWWSASGQDHKAWTGSGPQWWTHFSPQFKGIDWGRKRAVQAEVSGEFRGEPMPAYTCDAQIRTLLVALYNGDVQWDTSKPLHCGGTHSDTGIRKSSTDSEGGWERDNPGDLIRCRNTTSVFWCS